MDKKIEEKIQVLTARAKESKTQEKEKSNCVDFNIPNSLADHIKSKDQAKSFMILLKSY